MYWSIEWKNQFPVISGMTWLISGMAESRNSSPVIKEQAVPSLALLVFTLLVARQILFPHGNKITASKSALNPLSNPSGSRSGELHLSHMD